MLFRWFLDMDMVEPGFDHSTFTRNRERLLGDDVFVVIAAAHVFVRDRGHRGLCCRRREWSSIEPVLQDGVDVAARPRAHGDGARARRFEAPGAVLLAQAQDAEARSLALLRMTTLREDRLDELRSARRSSTPT